MSKAPKQSFYCLMCNWEIKDTHKHLDGIRCPKCGGLVQTGKRLNKENRNSERKNGMDSNV